MFKGSVGQLLLAIYLILVGITAFVSAITVPPIVLAGVALAAGTLLIIGK